ncbi:hypothetical protein SUGI_0648630 [Cryptomeria japonica]|nr:hypothetical protein SUGI_0648630 [Cryptomeria japonica]
MDIPLFSWYSMLLTAALLILFFFFLWRRERSLSLPPGPSGWPILGNLLQLRNKPHESLYALSLKYGPLMTLRLGMRTVVVVSSPAMAKEVFKTHDNILAGRMVTEAHKSLSHDKSSLICADYGPYWRHLRPISTVELFSPKRLEALQHLRRDQVFSTIRLIFEDKGKVVNIAHTVFCTSLNLLGNMIFSTSVFDPHNPASAGLKDTICELMVVARKPNLVDFFPFLRFLDPQRVSREMDRLFKEFSWLQPESGTDLDRLPYLHAAVKEVLRLRTTGPLLLPHKATSSCEIGGFVIPKDTQVMVNVWAMGRDPAIWKNPLEFTPERFLEGENSKIDYRGQDFELIPFGAGRRMCPGLPLASCIVHFVLASLIHSFEWKLPDGMSCEQMDMSDDFGITLKKAADLRAIPTPRLPHPIY